MHLSDGEIKAYQDQELEINSQQRVVAHLDTCTRCQQRNKVLNDLSQKLTTDLNALDPVTKNKFSSANTAHNWLTARLQEKETNNMWKKITSPQARPVWIGLVIVILLAISMTFAPVRAIANSFLGLFRVEQFTIVQVNPADLPEQLGSSSQLEYLLTQNLQIEERGEAYQVADKNEASQRVGFEVRLPTGMIKPLNSLDVQPGGQVTFVVDSARVQLILNEIGRSDIQIPEEVDGALVTLEIPDGITTQYGNCEYDLERLREAGYDPDDPKIPQLPDCITLVQLPSPTITAPTELNLVEIGEAYLQLLGMSAEEAHEFAQKVDWSTTFVVPLPNYGTAFQDVSVDGVSGVLISQELDEHTSQFMLMWVKDGIAYVLTGPGGKSTALNIARSLR